MAVQRSLGWVVSKSSTEMTEERYRLLSSIPASLYILGSFSILVLAENLEKGVA